MKGDNMDVLTAIKERHSVRRYTDRKIDSETIRLLQQEIALCNEEGDMHIQLITDEPDAFTGTMANYGHFEGVTDYIAIVGRKTSDFAEKCGYYGERVVLKAQQLGLNTCWVALTYNKRKKAFSVEKGEKFSMVISLGYGSYQGKPHKSKPIDEISKSYNTAPLWFKNGVDAAMLAPTAMNQQKFTFELVDINEVIAKASLGFYSKVDLGIARLHFEIGAGKDNFTWK